MILGGVFERFPDLRVAFVETEADWIAPPSASWTAASVGRRLDRWAATLQRMRQFTALRP